MLEAESGGRSRRTRGSKRQRRLLPPGDFSWPAWGEGSRSLFPTRSELTPRELTKPNGGGCIVPGCTTLAHLQRISGPRMAERHPRASGTIHTAC